MHVNFVTKGGPHLVSYRGRILVPAVFMRARGWEVTIGPFVPADVHVFSKHFDCAGDRQRLKQSPFPIYDLCDDHFGDQFADHYRYMVDNAALVITSSEGLTRIAGRGTPIYEPYELPERPVRTPTEKKGLWYGHSSNLYTIRGQVDRLLEDGWELRIITSTPAPGIPGGEVEEFSLERQEDALDWCHVVFLPQPKFWKSPNRAVEAFRAGRFPLMDDIPAYQGWGLPTGGVWDRLDEPFQRDWTAELAAAQAKVADEFSPTRIGQQWYDCISAAVARSYPATRTSTPLTSALIL